MKTKWMKSWIWKLLVVALVFGGIVLYGVRVWKVNRLYEVIRDQCYGFNEPIDCDGFRYTVLGTEIRDYEYREFLQGSGPDAWIDEKGKAIVLTFSVENISDANKLVDLTPINLEYNYQRVDYSLDLYNQWNPDVAHARLTLRPGSVHTFQLPYKIYEQVVRGNVEDYDKYPCNLIINLYPEKKYCRIF